MPAPTLRRLATGLVATTAALLAVLAPATIANAASFVDVSIGNLAQTMVTGSRARFLVQFADAQAVQINNVSMRVVIDLPGLNPDQVQLAAGRNTLTAMNTGPGQVTFDDPTAMTIAPRRPVLRQLTLQFNNGVPPGTANVTVSALDQGVVVIGSTSTSTNVVIGNGAPTDSPTGPPSPTAPAATVAVPTQGPTLAVEPLAGNGNSVALPSVTSSVPTLIYVLGGLLICLGGLILWLVFRRDHGTLRGLAHAAGGRSYGAELAGIHPMDPPERHASLGYPTGPTGDRRGRGPQSSPTRTTLLPGATSTTRRMPTVPDRRPPDGPEARTWPDDTQPTPAVDPWAQEGGGQDRTSPFGPRPY
jgi:hypothetical protein